MSVLQKESTPFPRKRQPSAEGGEDVKGCSPCCACATIAILLLHAD